MFIQRKTEYYKYDSAKATKWRKVIFSFFKIQGWKNQIFICNKRKETKKKITSMNTFHQLQKLTPNRWIINLNVNPKPIKLIEGNIGENLQRFSV